MAISGSVLQGNSPLPTSPMCRSTRIRWQGIKFLTRDCPGAIAGKPMGPVFIPHTKSLTNKQSLKAGTIDKQIAFNAFTSFQMNSFDIARLIIQFDTIYFPFNTIYPPLFRVSTQILGIKPRIEMEGVGNTGQR